MSSVSLQCHCTPTAPVPAKQLLLTPQQKQSLLTAYTHLFSTKRKTSVCRQLLIFQQPQHKPICPLQGEQQILWDASSCSAHTGTNILPPVPRSQHMLANIPVGSLNNTVPVIKDTVPIRKSKHQPLAQGTLCPGLRGPNPCQPKMVMVPCFSPALQPQGQVSWMQKSLSINKEPK